MFSLTLMLISITTTRQATAWPQALADDAKQHLLALLASNTSHESYDKLQQHRNLMQSTYSALPKHSNGNLGHQSIRYLLHRFFIEQHGWYIKGLEPSTEAPAPQMSSYWLPSYLQGVLQQHVGENGVDLHAVAALAVSLEYIIGREATSRFNTIRKTFDMPRNATVEQFIEALSAFMMVFHEDVSLLAVSKPELQQKITFFRAHYEYWKQASDFINDEFQKGAQLTDQGSVDVERSAQIVQTLNSQFYRLNDRQCRDLKKLLISSEEVPGRIKLTSFYNMTHFTDWDFDETPAYLRRLGALEEAESGVQRVITTNYIQSLPNCIDSSNFFSVCCRNECEDLMAHLEGNLSAPLADSELLLQLAAALPSDTVTAPRKIPKSLQDRLKQIADVHHGQVPLHGRLFAQWMHHAFPRECPYPHTSGSAHPFTANEWMQQKGEAIKFQSHEHIKEFVRSVCGSHGDCETLGSTKPNDLPWSTEEELPLVIVNHQDSSQAISSDKADNPSLSLQSLAILVVVLGVLVNMVMNRSGSVAFQFLRGIAVVLFIYVADPVVVIVTLGAGLVISKVLPYIQQKSKRNEAWKESKLCSV